MPTLMYSLPKEAQRGLSPPSAWGGMDERCRKVRIRLMPGRGWRMSGASHNSASVQVPRPAVGTPHGWI